MPLDSTLYPRLTRYLGRLPEGLASYPENLAKASIYRGAFDHAPGPVDAAGLPPELVPLVETPLPRSAWIPEAHNSAMYLAMADQFFPADGAFLDWVEEISADVFTSPLYRFLMMMVSPKRLAKGAERRWQTFHKGTDYRVEVTDNGSMARLEFPEHLFDELVLKATCRAIQTAYQASGAPDASYTLTGYGPTWATMRSVWYPEREKEATG